MVCVLGVAVIFGVVHAVVDANTATFRLESESMEPTLHRGARVTFDTEARCCERSDVVVFKTAPNPGWNNTKVDNIVKRVVGLPGETIEACGTSGDLAGKVCIDRRVLNEPYLAKPSSTTFLITSSVGCAPESPPTGCTIRAGYYYVMGDQRERSADSRIYGPVKASSVFGIR
jgi:signal peptidase I